MTRPLEPSTCRIEAGDTLQLEADRLNSMAEGIARHEGLAVFVPGLLPGEAAQVRVVKTARDFARAQPLHLSRPAANRVAARCPLHHQPEADGSFAQPFHCGGCQLQVMSREDQLAFKRTLVAENLARVGRIEADVSAVASGDPWGYRNKMSFTLTTEDGHLRWGLRSQEDGDIAVPLHSCDIARPDLWKAACQIIEVLDQEFGPPLIWNGEQGVVRAATIRCHSGRTSPPKSPSDRASLEAAVICLFAVATTEIPHLVRIADALTHLSDVRVYFTYSDPRANSVHFDAGRFLNRPPGRPPFWGEANYREEICAWHTLGGWPTLVGPTNFLQVNDEMAGRLYSRILGFPFDGGLHAIDAYCGVGVLTRALAHRFERVMGIELDTQAIKLARTTSRRLHDCRVEWVAEPAEAVFGRIAKEPPRSKAQKPDLVVVDPPRKGCQPEVIHAILALKPSDVIYVSCHPAALARDLKMLCAKEYRIAAIEPFDLFPQTHHVETLVHLKR
jgi:23S rRNA (uracil1939-C5)-methyltransferase